MDADILSAGARKKLTKCGAGHVMQSSEAASFLPALLGARECSVVLLGKSSPRACVDTFQTRLTWPRILPAERVKWCVHRIKMIVQTLSLASQINETGHDLSEIEPIDCDVMFMQVVKAFHRSRMIVEGNAR